MQRSWEEDGESILEKCPFQLTADDVYNISAVLGRDLLQLCAGPDLPTACGRLQFKILRVLEMLEALVSRNSVSEEQGGGLTHCACASREDAGSLSLPMQSQDPAAHCPGAGAATAGGAAPHSAVPLAAGAAAAPDAAKGGEGAVPAAETPAPVPSHAPAPFPASAGTKASGSAIMTETTAPSAAPAMATDLGVSCNQQPAPPVLEGEADENSLGIPFPSQTFAIKALSWFSGTIPADHPGDHGSNSSDRTITSSVYFPYRNLTEWFGSGPGPPWAKPPTSNPQTNVTLAQSSEYQPRPPPWPPPAENRLSPEREKGRSVKQFHHLVTRATCHLTACCNHKGLRGGM